eukprot:2430619-Prymnesium_polylepis.2
MHVQRRRVFAHQALLARAAQLAEGLALPSASTLTLLPVQRQQNHTTSHARLYAARVLGREAAVVREPVLGDGRPFELPSGLEAEAG